MSKFTTSLKSWWQRYWYKKLVNELVRIYRRVRTYEEKHNIKPPYYNPYIARKDNEIQK